MINTQKTNMFNSNERSYYRFSKKELLEQKKDLLLYIINELCATDVASLQQGIADIKALTGLDISLEQATELKRLHELNKHSNSTSYAKIK